MGFRVVWLEPVLPDSPPDELAAQVLDLRRVLTSFGLEDALALCAWKSDLSLPELPTTVDLEERGQADLLLNLAYDLPSQVVRGFCKSAFVDIDPGLTQIWLATGALKVPRHDLYFTIGETVGRPDSGTPACDVRWIYTPPLVYLGQWPVIKEHTKAPFSTVSRWSNREFVEGHDGLYQNDKRSGFLPFLQLPKLTDQAIELALPLDDSDPEVTRLRDHRWLVRDARVVAGTPDAYRNYIHSSAGEFSCAKPSCVRLQNSWISDRTLCYLASGKPAVVQHTGVSSFLPETQGLFRFHNLEEARRYLECVAADYALHSSLARSLVEEHFDAVKNLGRILEHAL